MRRTRARCARDAGAGQRSSAAPPTQLSSLRVSASPRSLSSLRARGETRGRDAVSLLAPIERQEASQLRGDRAERRGVLRGNHLAGARAEEDEVLLASVAARF